MKTLGPIFLFLALVQFGQAQVLTEVIRENNFYPFDKIYRWTYDYDSQGHQIQEQTYTFLSGGFNPGNSTGWELETRSQKSYHPDGRIKDEVFEKIGSGWTSGQLVYIGRADYSYDSLNRLSAYAVINQNTALHYEDRYFYDSIGQLVEITQTPLTSQVNNPFRNRRKLYYNSQGKLHWEQLDYWDANSQNWIKKEEKRYSYNAQGRLASFRVMDTSSVLSDTILLKYFDYDAQGRLQAERYRQIRFIWGGNYSFFTYHRTAYSYNTNSLIDTIFYHYGDSLTSSFPFAMDRDRYYYGTIGLNESPSFSLNLFPNPVVNQVEIESDVAGPKQVQILDLEGRLHLESSFTETRKTLSLGHLKAGNYILLLKSDEGVGSKVLVKL